VSFSDETQVATKQMSVTRTIPSTFRLHLSPVAFSPRSKQNGSKALAYRKFTRNERLWPGLGEQKVFTRD